MCGAVAGPGAGGSAQGGAQRQLAPPAAREGEAVTAQRDGFLGAQRRVGTLRRECLDHLLIYGEPHLRRVLAEYAQHYNERRPHHSREQRPPLHQPGQPIDITARIKRRQIVHGLIGEYRRAA